MPSGDDDQLLTAAGDPGTASVPGGDDDLLLSGAGDAAPELPAGPGPGSGDDDLLLSGAGDDGSGPATPVEPSSMASAIVARWAEAGLDAVAGGLRQLRAGDLDPQQTGTIFRIQRGSADFQSSTSTLIIYAVTFRVRAVDDADLAYAGAAAIDAAFNGRSLSWRTGFTGMAIQAKWESGTEASPPGMGEVYYDEIEYAYKTKGAR